MSIIGKMIIDEQSFNLLAYRTHFFQSKDIAGRPRGRVSGGFIEVTIEAHRDHIFHHWTLQPEQMRDLVIVFSPVIKVSKSRTIELYDVFCAKLAVHFDNYTTSPMTYTLLLSPGILVDGGVVFKKPWHVTDLDAMGGDEETDPEMRPKPKFLEYYFENAQGVRIENEDVTIGDTINLVVKSENAIGKSIDINLHDHQKDFEYNGQRAENDVIKGIQLTGNLTRITLKVLEEG